MNPIVASGALGAVSGALIAFLGTTLNSILQRKFEAEKSTRAERADNLKETRLALAALVKSMASTINTIQWLTYYPRVLNVEVTEKQASTYDETMAKCFPEMLGSLYVIASLNYEVFAGSEPWLEEMADLDSEVIELLRIPTITTQARLSGLSAIHEKAIKLDRRLRQSFQSQLRNVRPAPLAAQSE